MERFAHVGPRAMSSARAEAMSETTRIIPRAEPGGALVISLPKWIEHSERET